MLTYQIITQQHTDYSKVMDLYQRSFPENERKNEPYHMNPDFNSTVILGFYDNDQFVGFSNILFFRDIAHIIFFAIDPLIQSHGYGSQALQLMHQIYADYRFVVDVEAITKEADNIEQRKQRDHFYYMNGYFDTEISYRWQDDEYIVLAYRNTVSDEEFSAFWNYFDNERQKMKV